MISPVSLYSFTLEGRRAVLFRRPVYSLSSAIASGDDFVGAESLSVPKSRSFLPVPIRGPILSGFSVR